MHVENLVVDRYYFIIKKRDDEAQEMDFGPFSIHRSAIEYYGDPLLLLAIGTPFLLVQRYTGQVDTLDMRDYIVRECPEEYVKIFMAKKDNVGRANGQNICPHCNDGNLEKLHVAIPMYVCTKCQAVCMRSSELPPQIAQFIKSVS